MKKFLIPLCLLLCIACLAGCTEKEESSQTGLEIFNAHGTTGRYADATKTGTVTVLNFWGTWCPYCVYEMPHLDQLASAYGDRLTVIAAHTDIAETDAVEYVARNFPDSRIIFVNDAENRYYSAMGGNGSYPYSLILDANGTVVNSFYGYRSYEQWVAAVTELIG